MKKPISFFLIVLCMSLLLACSSTKSTSSTATTNASYATANTEALTPIESFAKENNVSVNFATSLDTAVKSLTDKFNRSFTIDDVYNFDETDPWLSGKRYTIWLVQEYVLTVYEQNDEVVSIRKSNGDFLYSKQ